MRSTGALRHLLRISIAALLTASTAAAQTPTAATLTQWDIFKATGGDITASQNIASVFLDSSGIAGPAGSVWVAMQAPKPRLGRLSPSAIGTNYLEWRPIVSPEVGGVPTGLALNRSTGDLWMALQGDPPFVMKVGNSDRFLKYRSASSVTTHGITVDVSGAAIAALPTRNVEGIGNALIRLPRAAGAGTVTMTMWQVGGEPRHVALDGSGEIWYTARAANLLGRLHPSDGTVTEWALPAGTQPAGLWASGDRVCVVSAGVTGAQTGVAHCLDVAMNQFTQYARAAGGGFDVPQRVVANSDGELFVTEQRGDAVSFVSRAARTGAPVIPVMPISRTVIPVTATMSVVEGVYSPVEFAVAASERALTGVDNGLGHVRFALPRPTLSYPFPQTGYPQPVSVSAVADDLGPGTGSVFVGEFYSGSIAGRQAGARLDRLTLVASVPPPAIVANPATLRFDAMDGSAAPGAQAIAVTEASGSALSWTASKTAAWLTLSPSSGSAPASMTVSVDHAALAPGAYSDTIVIDDGPGGAGPRNVAVELNVTGQASLALSPASLTFAVVANGSFPPAQTVSVTNAGAGSIDWTAAASQPWLSITPSSGVAPGAIQVTINPAMITPGTRTATLTVTAPGAANSPETIAVTAHVSATGPALAISPGSMTFAATAGGPVPAARSLTIANTGGGTIAWTATSSAPWLFVSPASGSALGIPGGESVVTVSVDQIGLGRGTHGGTITITDPNVAGSPATLAVSFTVTAPAITPSVASLAFTTPAGRSPASRSFTVTNTGDAPLTFTPAPSTSSGGAWLAVSPSGSTTLAPGAGVTVSVAIASAALAAATYGGTITIADPNATNSPVSIPVTLSVVNGPFIELTPASLTFSALRGRSPAAQPITVTNTGNATLSFSAAAAGGSWLSVSPASGVVAPGATATLSAVVASGALASGTYSGSISVTDPAAANSPQSVAVSLVVQPAPTITLLPATLTFAGGRWTTCNGIESGQTLAAQSLTLGNSGDGTMNFTAAASGGAWLSVLPASGVVTAGGTQPLTVAASLRGLSRGTYTGQVTVADPNATNLMQLADVTLTVGNAAATLCVTPASMTFGTIGRNSTTATQILQILNVGDEPMGGWNATWTASRGTVNLSSSSGSSPTSISVSVTSTNQRGDQTGTITISAAGAGNSPVTVNLTWTVN